MRRFILFLLICASQSVVRAAVETETNNTEATADILAAGTLLAGSLSSAEDQDFFLLEVGGSTDNLELVFGAPDGGGEGDQWLVLVQRPVDRLIIFQEVLSPDPGSPVTRNVAVDRGGNYLIRISAPANATEASSKLYNLTVTPDNYTPPPAAFNGVWQDDAGSFYSIHENGDGFLYIKLGTEPLEWAAFFGPRNGDRAVLELVVGPGSATLELTFTSENSLQATYLACDGSLCSKAPGELLYTATLVFAD